MANEAFALSPISARATQPSDEDYDAISEAFMETTRGRWFLGEYAKRNRNADTRMVLDAVARIEQGLAAQKQPAPETRLPEALADIRTALEQARAVTSAALDSLALKENLAPVHKSIRVIREISWRWREIGADGRICDLIDQHINAIETSCGHIASADPQAALDAAFALLGERIAAYDDRDESGPATVASTQHPPAEAGPVEAMAVAEPASAEANIKTAGTTTETAPATMQATDTESGPAPEVTAQIADVLAEADAHDEAVLDMIAAEMGAPDPSDAEFEIGAGNADSLQGDLYQSGLHPSDLHPNESYPSDLHPGNLGSTDFGNHDLSNHNLGSRDLASHGLGSRGLGVVDLDDVGLREIDSGKITASNMVFADPPPPREPATSTREAPAMPTAQPPVPQPPDLPTEISREPSLGSALIAHGIVRKPATAANDPLAPIRRLSQAEKVALFS